MNSREYSRRGDFPALILQLTSQAQGKVRFHLPPGALIFTAGGLVQGGPGIEPLPAPQATSDDVTGYLAETTDNAMVVPAAVSIDLRSSIAEAFPQSLRLPQIPAIRVTARGVLAWLLAAAIFALPVLLFAPFLETPFMRDEAFYASVAQAMRHGEMPYAYGFDNKPPMIFYWYYASFGVFGENVWAPRLMVSLLLSAGSALVYLQARLMFSHRWGLVAALIFGLSMGIAQFETNANTEYFLIPVAMLALLAFTLGERVGGWQWYAVCGAASGIAVMTKQTSLFLPAVFAMFALYPVWRRRSLQESRRAWLALGQMTAGGAASLAVILLPFAITGTLGEFYRGAIVYATEYSDQLSAGQKLSSLVNVTPRKLFITAGPWTLLALAGAVVVIRKPNRETLLLVAWMAASAAGVAAAGRFYAHYFVALLPGMALLAVPALQWLRENRRNATLMAPAALVLGLAVISPLKTNADIYFQPNADERHLAKYNDDRMAQWEIEAQDAGEWIAAITRPGEKIYEFGFMPGIYFHADRLSPTQFTFKHPFAINESYAEEAVKQLEADKPVVIFDSATYERDGNFTYHGQTVALFIAQNYVYAGKYFFGDVWLLQGWEPAQPLPEPAPY